MSDLAPEAPEPSDRAKEAKSLRRWTIGWFSSVAFVVILIITNQLIELPYYVLQPGAAKGVKQYVQLPEANQHLAKGDFLFTTVGLLRAHPFDIVVAWIEPGDEIESKKDILGNQTPAQYTDENNTAMSDSKEVATFVAMNRAGFKTTELGDGGEIVAVIPNSPAAGKLDPGDVITAVNGTKVGIASDVTAPLRALAVGQVAHLDVTDSKGAKRALDVTLGARPDNTPGGFVGIEVSTKNSHLDTPFSVGINTSHVGGPSAGLAFTLALLDELTPGELTGGKQVAVTGTMASDGTVGPVGGVAQKTAAVNRGKAQLFLVPSDEYAVAAKKADKDVKVVAVDTLDQALKALAANGGDVSGVPAAPAAAGV